jgi:hypothetical protein
MRFMMLVKGSADSEAGVLPSAEELNEMGRYNDELVKAGVLLAADGLQASDKGARVDFSDGRATVTDGPFAEAKELIAGYWIIEVASKAEALQWATRVPFVEGQVEVRQVFELTDFDEIDPDVSRREQAMRDAISRS